MNPALTQTTVPLTLIRFPEITLQTRDAHKLRGYFGNLFKEHSPVLHNHYEDGRYRHRYPTVQYKVLDTVPTLVGLKEGAELLTQLFLKMKEIELDGRAYAVHTKNIEHRHAEIGYSDQLHEYRFQTLWMGLNQDNHRKYLKQESWKAKEAMLQDVLTAQILGFFKNIPVILSAQERLMTKVNLKEKATNFKNNRMIAFEGGFICNVLLPEGIGIGKAVSRGFGTLKRI
ncbi:MAG: CRISPR-associated endonuclease Cas6 [Owenweeksia sp.]|nr:CRISPR-associated endonuclease Cas6 [Owenweeksia sp.]